MYQKFVYAKCFIERKLMNIIFKLKYFQHIADAPKFFHKHSSHGGVFISCYNPKLRLQTDFFFQFHNHHNCLNKKIIIKYKISNIFVHIEYLTYFCRSVFLKVKEKK